MTTDPDEYPAQCDTDSEGLQKLKEYIRDEDHPLGEKKDLEWPPEDRAGNVYPIFFDPAELNDQGRLYDERYNPYNPFSGNLEPITRDEWGACNAPLHDWRNRYPQIRFCGKVYDKWDDDYEYERCPTHKGSIMKTAEEQMQTGMFVNSVDHLYEKLSPWQQLVGWGTFESLMGESTYEYAEEYKQKEFDFSEEPFVPDGANKDGILTVKCGYPTQHPDRSLSLYVAAMKTVQMMSVQPEIMAERTREDGTEEGMMETRSVEKAQLTAPPSEHDSSPQTFKTIETWNEHHLNLPFSRLIRDRPKLLEYGGVSTDVSDEDTSDVVEDDIVLEIHGEAENVDTKEDTGTDPNAFGDDYTPESEHIVESASDSTSSS